MYSERLRLLRKERGWILDDVADKIGIARSTYSGYETGHRKPPIETLIKLAELYEVSADYILGLTDDPRPYEIQYNARKYLSKDDLNWDGVPLTDEELKPIRDLLEIVVRDRLPEKVVK